MMIVLNVPSRVVNALLFVVADIMLVGLIMSVTSYLESLLMWRKVRKGGAVKIKELPLPVVGDNLLGVNVGSYLLLLTRVAIIASLFVATIGINGETAPGIMTERRDVKVATGRENGELKALGLIDPVQRREESFKFAQCIQQKRTERIYYRFGANICKGLQEESSNSDIMPADNCKRGAVDTTSVTCLDGVQSLKEEVDARLELFSETAITDAKKETTVGRKDLPVTSWGNFNPFAALVTLKLPSIFLNKYLRFNDKEGNPGSGELVCLVSNWDLSNFIEFKPSFVFSTSSYRVQCLSNLWTRSKLQIMNVRLECEDQECKTTTTSDLTALEFQEEIELSPEDVRNVSRVMVGLGEGRELTPLELYDSWWIYSLNVVGPEVEYEARRTGVTVSQTTIELYSLIIFLFWTTFGLVLIIYRLIHRHAHQLNTVNGLSKLLEERTNPAGEYGSESLHANIGITASGRGMRIGPVRECVDDILRAKAEGEESSSAEPSLEIYFDAM